MTPATTHHEPAGRRLTRSALLRRPDRWCRSRHRRERRVTSFAGPPATRAARSGARSRSSSGGTSCPRTTPGWTSGRVAGVSRTTSRLRSTASLHAPSVARSGRGEGWQGHDIFGFLSPPAAYEDDVLDHADVVAEVERAVGPYGELGKRSTYNPKTKTYFGVSNSYVPSPALWRRDVWQSIGESPATWDHVRAAAPKLRELGHPIGIGQSGEPDSNVALTSLLMCFGSSLQTEANVPAIDTPRPSRRCGSWPISGRAPRTLASFPGTPPRTTSSSSRARVAHPERDLGCPLCRDS